MRDEDNTKAKLPLLSNWAIPALEGGLILAHNSDVYLGMHLQVQACGADEHLGAVVHVQVLGGGEAKKALKINQDSVMICAASMDSAEQGYLYASCRTQALAGVFVLSC